MITNIKATENALSFAEAVLLEEQLRRKLLIAYFKSNHILLGIHTSNAGFLSSVGFVASQVDGNRGCKRQNFHSSI